jgi:mono/diheme cytochrome c family protein
MLAANTPRTIGIILVGVVVVGWLVYLLANLRRSRKEVGAELELAPNRKPYYDDDELEGPRLERVQLLGLLTLAATVIALPLYWVFEPGRQSGAVAGYEARFASWGGQLFATQAEDPRGFGCAGCHGGMNAVGGVAAWTITDDTTGEVRAVSWKAPALNTVFYRYSEDEVRYIIVYGRPFSPMSPWGLDGGGPLNEQQVNNIIAYLRSIQIPMEGCAEGERICEGGRVPEELAGELQGEIDQAIADGRASGVGEAIFNLETGSGAYSCARCHTSGWSYDEPAETGGGGSLGPNLTGGSEVRQFDTVEDNVEFLRNPPEQGRAYGNQGQSSGRMPAFGAYYTDEQLRALAEYIRGL